MLTYMCGPYRRQQGSDCCARGSGGAGGGDANPPGLGRRDEAGVRRTVEFGRQQR